jgi:chromosome segregation protein
MHLRAIKLRGFKSFPDPVEVRLEPGVSVVVGPNGSGKSNVADAIVWAAGSLAPSELRAERPDDVLFAGSGDRPAAPWCEVELLFDNEDGRLGLDFAEVSVTRRLHRGGEGQYLVNGAGVRRLDLVELLSDIGLGSGMHSIVSQGKVEAVLASRPAERRTLVEEAAGLGKFKQRRHRAELKLARVALEVDRARDVEAEVRKRLRPLALQASAAERAERLGGEIAVLRATIAGLDVASLEERLAGIDEGRAAAAVERRRTDRQLEGLLTERQEAEDELADAAGRREAATAALYRLRSAAERAGLRREAATDLAERLAAALEEAQGTVDPDEPSREELERAAEEASARARTTATAADGASTEAKLARDRLASLERALAEREGLPPAARALAEEGAPLVLSLVDVEPGSERAVAAALGPRAAALLVPDAEAGLELLDRARKAGLGSARVLVGREPADLVERLPVVPLGRLLESTVPAVTEEGFGFDPHQGELWFVGETAETVLLELESRRRALADECLRLQEQARGAAQGAERAAAAAREAAAALARAPAGRRRGPATVLLPRMSSAAGCLSAALDAGSAIAEALEPRLRARADAGSVRTGTLATRLRELGAAEAELRRAANDAAERAAAIEAERAGVEAELREARRRLVEAGAEPGVEGTRDELVAKLERLERRREELGRVNPFAKEEYEQEKARLDELSLQRDDLERSLAELEQLRAELTETVERRFTETFAAVKQNFADAAASLFPGGEGRLRLTEADDGEEEAGVEVELRPAGKRNARLSLLSGGEKALGAIAFLFALFLARPCAFYLLDEVEAALDDPNIGRFIELLRTYADRAQFIVITHQKRTMEAADILYGVTMGADGVSQIVSRRMAGEAQSAVA